MARSVARGFGVVRLRKRGAVSPAVETRYGTFTASDAVLSAPAPAVPQGARCYPLPPQAFEPETSAEIDAAGGTLTFYGYSPAVDPATGVALRVVGVGSVTPPVCALVAGTTLEPFAVLAPAPGSMPSEWFPGVWTRASRWVLRAIAPSEALPRVYVNEHGSVHALPAGDAAAPFVVENEPGARLPPHQRALRPEFRGPITGAVSRVLRPMFSAGSMFAGMPEFVGLPGGAAGIGWRLVAELIERNDAPSGLYLVETSVDHTEARHPVHGATLELLYFDREDAAFYTAAAPMAEWLAGNLAATSRREAV